MGSTLLYHGTNAKYINSILKKGILPRKHTNRSNWKHTVQSRSDLVYLTDCYALTFAVSADINAKEEDDDKYAIIEIETDMLDPSKFYPDEDYIVEMVHAATCSVEKDAYKTIIDEQVLNDIFHIVRNEIGISDDMLYSEDKKNKIHNLTTPLLANFNLFQRFRYCSLEGRGTLAYKGSIPVSAITRIAKMEWSENQYICGMALNTTNVNLFSHPYTVGHSRAITRWIMGEQITYDELITDWVIKMNESEIISLGKDRDRVEAEIADRIGVHIRQVAKNWK